MERASRGRQEYEALMGSAPEETLAAVRASSPQLYETVVDGAFEGLEVQNRLDGVEIRTLVLAGELDASCTPEIMVGIAERIPRAVYEELPGTAHMQTLERPELVAQALDRFLPAHR